MWVSKLTGNIEWERHAVNVCDITDGAVGPDAAKSKSNAAMHTSHTVPISRVDFSCHHCVCQTPHAPASEGRLLPAALQGTSNQRPTYSEASSF